MANYRTQVAAKSDLERTDLAKEKTGVFTGAYAINPVNGESIPIWIADYVLMGYGTGAIMAVPAHDERDLSLRSVTNCRSEWCCRRPGWTKSAIGFIGDGVAINSPLIDGLPTAAAKEKITRWLERSGHGKRRVNYKLRDWLFSRQRYWGEPFPIVWRDGKHEAHSRIGTATRSAAARRFQAHRHRRAAARQREGLGALCPTAATRETNTMPQWAGLVLVLPALCDPEERIREMKSVSLAKKRNATGWEDRNRAASISTSAARSTPCCICSTRASGTRCSSISATFRSRSRFSGW